MVAIPLSLMTTSSQASSWAEPNERAQSLAFSTASSSDAANTEPIHRCQIGRLSAGLFGIPCDLAFCFRGRLKRHYFGGCCPGELSHSLMCEPVSACRARRISRSRSTPWGVPRASLRSFAASLARRTSSDSVWVKWRRRMVRLLRKGRRERNRRSHHQ